MTVEYIPVPWNDPDTPALKEIVATYNYSYNSSVYVYDGTHVKVGFQIIEGESPRDLLERLTQFIEEIGDNTHPDIYLGLQIDGAEDYETNVYFEASRPLEPDEIGEIRVAKRKNEDAVAARKQGEIDRAKKVLADAGIDMSAL